MKTKHEIVHGVGVVRYDMRVMRERWTFTSDGQGYVERTFESIKVATLDLGPPK